MKLFLVASLDNHILKTDYKKVIFILVKKQKVALLFKKESLKTNLEIINYQNHFFFQHIHHHQVNFMQCIYQRKKKKVKLSCFVDYQENRREFCHWRIFQWVGECQSLCHKEDDRRERM